MSEERVRILRMLEEGKIDVEEAEQLLQSLNSVPEKKEAGGDISHLKVLVEENGEQKVDISVPIKLAKSLLQFVPDSAQSKLEDKDIKLQEIINSIENLEGPSTLVNINDGGDHVVVKLE